MTFDIVKRGQISDLVAEAGRMLRSICRYAKAVYSGERIVAHGRLVLVFAVTLNYCYLKPNILVPWSLS